MLVKTYGAAVLGIDAIPITIEVNSTKGCMFYLVGLPDAAVKESHRRIWAKNEEQDGRLDDHERRIDRLERK